MERSERKKLILVDDRIDTLTAGRSALSGRYEVFTVPSGELLFRLLSKVTPDLILLDIEMPGMSGYDVARRLKLNHETAEIPIIFLSGRDDAGSELEGLSLGAIDYISKPFSPPLLLKRIELHLLLEEQKRSLKDYGDNLENLVRIKTATILELQNSVIEMVAELVEFRDHNTGGHIARTKTYLEILIRGMSEYRVYADEVREWDTSLLVSSAQLHDVGKISIPDAILRKPGKLTEAEFDIVRQHPVLGAQIIDRLSSRNPNQTFLAYAKILALYHHERWDGAGYPCGLVGDAIPLPARMMAIVDVYDALISERAYKAPHNHDEAAALIAEGSGTLFDPALVKVFLAVQDQFAAVTESPLAV